MKVEISVLETREFFTEIEQQPQKTLKNLTLPKKSGYMAKFSAPYGLVKQDPGASTSLHHLHGESF